MKKSKILIVTGGTGGHVIPAVNLFNYIDNNSKKIFLLTDYRGYEYIENIDNSKIFKIYSSHLSGSIKFKLIGLIKLLIGLFQSFIVFIRVRPKVIVAFGSYASTAPLVCFLLFKFFYKTKLYIHEQNSVIGQTNKFFLKYANKIFVNFDKEYSSIKKYKNKILVVGIPQKKFNKSFSYDQRTNFKSINFLVFAGSQGSLEILDFFMKFINKLNKVKNLKKINFIVQCPAKYQIRIKNLLAKNKYEFKINQFFNNFEDILSTVHIALCRSGAGTINDLINYRIPAIILPLASSKDNHQYENAKLLSKIGCAILTHNDVKKIDKIILFLRNVIDDKSFNKSLIDKYSKIKKYNANLLMWEHIQNEK